MTEAVQAMFWVKAYAKALRLHQWLKNALIFLPALAAHRLELPVIVFAAQAFLSFSLTASAVYVLNDRIDLTADRAHPRKRERPFASGAIPVSHGKWMIAALLIAALALALPLGRDFISVMVLYFAATTTYSFYLKRKLIADICMLAALYTVRILAGGVATNIPLSVWLLAFSMFFFMSLAAIKRQAELVDGVASGVVKAQGRGYHVDDLPLVSQMAISSGYVSVMVFALYLNSANVGDLYRNPVLLWGICPVLLYWISRMAMIAHRGMMHDDPVVFAVKDRTSQFCGLLVLVFGLTGTLL